MSPPGLAMVVELHHRGYELYCGPDEVAADVAVCLSPAAHACRLKDV